MSHACLASGVRWLVQRGAMASVKKSDVSVKSVQHRALVGSGRKRVCWRTGSAHHKQYEIMNIMNISRQSAGGKFQGHWRGEDLGFQISISGKLPYFHHTSIWTSSYSFAILDKLRVSISSFQTEITFLPPYWQL